MESKGRLAWVVGAVLLWLAVPVFGVTIVDVNLYESGTTNDSVIVAPGGTVDVDVVVIVTGDPATDPALAGYEMDIVDDYDFGSGWASSGLSIAASNHRVVSPAGWLDMSLATYPVELWNTPLDAAAVSWDPMSELPPDPSGASYVVETLTITAPASFPDDGCGPSNNGYYLTPLDAIRDPGLVFYDPDSVLLEIGELSGMCIIPEPGAASLLAMAGVGLLSRRRRKR